MKGLRVCVEWGFQKITNVFQALCRVRGQRVLLSPVGSYYRVCVLLANCHSCLYGNQTADYFDCPPPSLLAYISGEDV
jgi:hypothetical protein